MNLKTKCLLFKVQFLENSAKTDNTDTIYSVLQYSW